MFRVVYSVKTGRVRSFTGTGHSSQELLVMPVSPGEAQTQFDDSLFNTLPNLQLLITDFTGLTPSGDRFAVVDKTGKVVGTLFADLNCGDAVPGTTLMQSDTASVGWAIDPDTTLLTAPIQATRLPVTKVAL